MSDISLSTFSGPYGPRSYDFMVNKLITKTLLPSVLSGTRLNGIGTFFIKREKTQFQFNDQIKFASSAAMAYKKVRPD